MEHFWDINFVLGLIQKKLIGFCGSYQILNLYICGSRLFGTYNTNSDTDFLAIIKSEQNLTGILVIEEGDVNVSVYDDYYFQQIVDENVVWLVHFIIFSKKNCLILKLRAVMCSFLPSKFILLRNKEYHPKLRKRELLGVSKLDAFHTWSKARRFCHKGEILLSKKNILHSLRFLEFSLQFVRNLRVEDFFATNHIWPEASFYNFL